MMGDFQKSLKRNWQRLAALAVVASFLLGMAYWWDNRKEQEAEDLPATAAAPQREPLPDTELGRRVDRMLDRGGYQRTLPEIEKPKPQPKERTVDLPDWVGKAVLYILVGLGLFSIAVMIWILVTGSTGGKARQTSRRKTARKAEAPVVGSHALAQPASLEDARHAAREGNFGEAVRMLLASALITLAKQELVRLRPWMTGREIVRDARLDTRPTDALCHLVATVEAYAFAGHVITEETYEACFQHYQLLTGAGKGAA